jgi:dTDP-glucose 4,6-dehydratase
VLDKLTYSGNRANLEGSDVEFVQGDIADLRAVTAAAEGCAAILNFAGRDARRPLDLRRRRVHRDRRSGTYVLLDYAREHGIRLVQVSDRRGLRRRVRRGLVEGGRSAAAVEPVCGLQGRAAILQVLAAVRTYGVNASITAGSNTVRAESVPREDHPALHHQRPRRRVAPGLRRRPSDRDWLHVEDHCAGIELVLREGEPGGVYNVGGGEEVENRDLTTRILELTGADESLGPARRGPARARPPLLARHLEAALARLGRRAHARRRSPETVAWYRDNRDWWEPIKSGEYLEYYRRQYAARLS